MERVVRLIILKTIVVVAIIIISGGFQLKNVCSIIFFICITSLNDNFLLYTF